MTRYQKPWTFVLSLKFAHNQFNFLPINGKCKALPDALFTLVILSSKFLYIHRFILLNYRCKNKCDTFFCRSSTQSSNSDTSSTSRLFRLLRNVPWIAIHVQHWFTHVSTNQLGCPLIILVQRTESTFFLSTFKRQKLTDINQYERKKGCLCLRLSQSSCFASISLIDRCFNLPL